MNNKEKIIMYLNDMEDLYLAAKEDNCSYDKICENFITALDDYKDSLVAITKLSSEEEVRAYWRSIRK